MLAEYAEEIPGNLCCKLFEVAGTSSLKSRGFTHVSASLRDSPVLFQSFFTSSQNRRHEGGPSGRGI